MSDYIYFSHLVGAVDAYVNTAESFSRAISQAPFDSAHKIQSLKNVVKDMHSKLTSIIEEADKELAAVQSTPTLRVVKDNDKARDQELQPIEKSEGSLRSRNHTLQKFALISEEYHELLQEVKDIECRCRVCSTGGSIQCNRCRLLDQQPLLSL